MGIIKLQEAGQSVTWAITNAETTAGNFGPQVKFENGTDTIFLPEDSAMRQLSRIGLDVAGCIGETLVISRDPNPKAGAKPYWGIRLAGATDKAPPSKRLSHAEATSGGAKHIPGLDPDIPLPPEPEDDGPYADPGPLPPFHKPSHAAQVAPNATDRMRVAREYLDLLAWVQAESKLPPDVAQSASATIWITWGQKGLR